LPTEPAHTLDHVIPLKINPLGMLPTPEIDIFAFVAKNPHLPEQLPAADSVVGEDNIKTYLT